MSQAASVDTSSRTPTPYINPVLQAALSSLDVQLEEELFRYRRQKSGRPVSPGRGIGHQTSKPIELISVNSKNKTHSPNLGIVSAALASSNVDIDSPEVGAGLKAYQPLDATSATETANQVSFQVSRKTTQNKAENRTPSADATPQMDNSGARTEVGGNLIYPGTTQSEPEDYLESSEQLLRSLAEEETPVRKAAKPPATLLTPLGVGAMLLLLLSSATIGYILMNPGSLNNLSLGSLFAPKPSAIAQSPAIVPVVISSNQPKYPPIPNGPNLATDEFVDLNLTTLSSLKTSSAANPSPVAKLPTLPTRSVVVTNSAPLPYSPAETTNSDLASAILPPGLQSPRMMRVPSVAPIPAPAGLVIVPKASNKAASLPGRPANKQPQVVRPNATLAIAPIAKNYFYVLTKYESDRSLDLARAIVPNAYVLNFPGGARIQLGAFPKKVDAQKFAQALQKKGIPASIYHP